VTPVVITLPSGFPAPDVAALQVSDDGSVLALLTGQNDDFAHACGGDRIALLASQPGETKLRVLARSTGVKSAAAIASDGRAFGFCDALGAHHAETAEVVVAADTQTPTIARAAGIEPPGPHFAPQCNVSDRGSATMLIAREPDLKRVLITAGLPGAHVAVLPQITGYGLLGLSPSGGSAITLQVAHPQLFDRVDLQTGSTTGFVLPRKLATCCGGSVTGSTDYEPPTFDDADTSVLLDPFAPLLAVQTDPLVIWDAGTRRWSADRLPSPKSLCFLPSGRIVVPYGNGSSIRLSVTDTEGRSFTAVPTPQISAISAISCEGAQGGGAVVLVTTRGTIYTIPENQLDGSAVNLAMPTDG
jgi:hypothetical protein